MANPQIVQGTLNRLQGSVVFAAFPALTVTAPYLGKEAISIAFEGDVAQLIGTLTGGVTSPEPYQYATVTMHLVRSQALAETFKQQIETSALVGSVNVISDSSTLAPFQLENCVLMSLQDLTFDGTQTNFQVRLRGIYNINALMWAGS
jgi:hypothetical protein